MVSSDTSLRTTCFSLFFFNDTATTEIYTLSLHDALPILGVRAQSPEPSGTGGRTGLRKAHQLRRARDRKSTRLNSSHGYISYAVFCLKKKKTKRNEKTKSYYNTETRRQPSYPQSRSSDTH